MLQKHFDSQNETNLTDVFTHLDDSMQLQQ